MKVLRILEPHQKASNLGCQRSLDADFLIFVWVFFDWRFADLVVNSTSIIILHILWTKRVDQLHKQDGLCTEVNLLKSILNKHLYTGEGFRKFLRQPILHLVTCISSSLYCADTRLISGTCQAATPRLGFCFRLHQRLMWPQRDGLLLEMGQVALGLREEGGSGELVVPRGEVPDLLARFGGFSLPFGLKREVLERA